MAAILSRPQCVKGGQHEFIGQVACHAARFLKELLSSLFVLVMYWRPTWHKQLPDPIMMM